MDRLIEGPSPLGSGYYMAGRILSGIVALVVIGSGALLFPSARAYLAPVLPGFLTDAPDAPKRNSRRANRPLPVRVAVAERRDVPIRLDGVGTVKARSTVAIRSRVEGQLFEARVREGQTVRKGDVLFKLDARPLDARLKEAEAILARDRANRAKAVADVKRLTALAAKGYSPKTRVEDARTLADTFAATVRASEAQTELARLNLDYATIRSPINGRVGNILITPGNIVKPNDNQPLLVITETKPIYVSFGVPERHIDELRRRMANAELVVDVATQGGSSQLATGRLFFLNNEVDASTGTIQLLATFENEDERLIPGQFVRARVLLSTLRDAVLVPSRAVQINQRGHYVWIVAPDSTIKLRPVTLGPDDGGDIVIASGLKAGETVVTDGQLRLFPGAAVAPAGAKTGGGKRKRGGKREGAAARSEPESKARS